MQKIMLATLVKDEEHTLPRLVESALPAIDAWTIIDTGSTDRTRDVVMELLGGLPGQLLRRPWRGFAANRTELLNAIPSSVDYALMLDADHVLHIEGDKPKLVADAYTLRIRGNLEWRLPLLTRVGFPWRYEGAAHAHLASDQDGTVERSDWLSLDGGGGVTQDKLERDRVALEAEFLDRPDDPRTVFYLAQTYRDLDMPERAIRYYRLRADMNGWAEERFYARYQLGCLLSHHVAFAQGAPELLRAWQEHPSRVESLRALATAANHVADKAERPEDGLFVTPSAYERCG